MNTDRAALFEDLRRRLMPLRPERIVVFGSRARGEGSPDSDLDVIVVMRTEGSPAERGVICGRPLRGIGVPLDLIVYTPEEYAQYRTYPSSIVHAAEREGIVLHG